MESNAFERINIKMFQIVNDVLYLSDIKTNESVFV